jgi:hypothetical protein
VLADLDLAHAPVWAFAPEIASGSVRVVLADYGPGSLVISPVHPAGIHRDKGYRAAYGDARAMMGRACGRHTGWLFG